MEEKAKPKVPSGLYQLMQDLRLLDDINDMIRQQRNAMEEPVFKSDIRPFSLAKAIDITKEGKEEKKLDTLCRAYVRLYNIILEEYKRHE